MKNFLLAIACSLALSVQSMAVTPHPDGQSVSKISVIDGSPGGSFMCYHYVAVIDQVDFVPPLPVTANYLSVSVAICNYTPVVAKSYYYSWRQGGFNSCSDKRNTTNTILYKDAIGSTNTKNPYNLVLLKPDKLLSC